MLLKKFHFDVEKLDKALFELNASAAAVNQIKLELFE
jgi:hypothetical protein